MCNSVDVAVVDAPFQTSQKTLSCSITNPDTHQIDSSFAFQKMRLGDKDFCGLAHWGFTVAATEMKIENWQIEKSKVHIIIYNKARPKQMAVVLY